MAHCLAPQPKSPDDKRHSSSIPIEEKKSFIWIKHHRELVSLAQKIPHTQLINVCDREADFFEMFHEYQQNPCVDLLFRANYAPTIEGQSVRMFEAIQKTPVQGRIQINIPSQSARPRKSKQKARSARPGRISNLTIRYSRFELCPPKGHKDKSSVGIWLIHAIEENPPSGTNPVQWFLLTTIDINSLDAAVRCLRWYSFRWRIEDWHRVLKSGCRIESLAHDSATRLRRAIAINLVIAWRIMLMTLLGR